MNCVELVLCSDKDPNDCKQKNGNRNRNKKKDGKHRGQNEGQDADTSAGASNTDPSQSYCSDKDVDKQTRNTHKHNLSPTDQTTNNRGKNLQSRGQSSSSNSFASSDQGKHRLSTHHKTRTGENTEAIHVSAFHKVHPGHSYGSTSWHPSLFVPNPNPLPMSHFRNMLPVKPRFRIKKVLGFTGDWDVWHLTPSTHAQQFAIPDSEEQGLETQQPSRNSLTPITPIPWQDQHKSSNKPQLQISEKHTNQNPRRSSISNRLSSISSLGSSTQQFQIYVQNVKNPNNIQPDQDDWGDQSWVQAFQYLQPPTDQQTHLSTRSLTSLPRISHSPQTTQTMESSKSLQYSKILQSMRSSTDLKTFPNSQLLSGSSSVSSEHSLPISQGSHEVQGETDWQGSSSSSNSQHQDQHEQQGRKQTAIRYRQTPYHQRGHSPGPYSFSRVHGATTNQGSLRGASRSSSPSISPTRDQHAEISPSGYHSFPPYGHYQNFPYVGSGSQEEGETNQGRVHK